MKNRPWANATAHTIHKDRRESMPEILIQQPEIEPLDVVDETIDRVTRRHGTASSSAHAAAAIGIGKQGADVFGEPRGVAGRGEQSDLIAVDDIADAAHVG